MEKAQPLISIIVPVYNVGKYLPHTLESLHNQTYQNFEVICVNDGSTDDCPQIIQNMAQQDKRFVLINQKNQGLPGARNSGLQAAQGQYIMFVDGDDYLHPQCVELAVKAITASQTDICQFAHQIVDIEEKPNFAKYAVLPESAVFTNLLENFLQHRLPLAVMAWNKIYKAEIAKTVKFRQVRPSEDDLYTFETLTKAHSMSFIPTVLYYYVQVPTSIMHTLQTATYHQNRRRVAEEYSKIVAALAPTLQHDKPLQKLLYKRFYNRYLFKEFIIKLLQNPQDRTELAANVACLRRLQQNNTIDFKHLRIRFRLAFWLLEHNLYSPAQRICRIHS